MHNSVVSSRVVCHSAQHLCYASWRQHRKTSMFNYFFSSYTTSSITSVTLANRSTEAPLYKLSNMPKWKRDNGIGPARCNFTMEEMFVELCNNTPAFMMRDYCESRHSEKRSNKSYFTSVLFDSPYHHLHAIQICVHCQVFFLFWSFLMTRQGKTRCLLAIVCLRS